MLKLDKNIRANAAHCFTQTIPNNEIAELPFFWGTTQQNEAEKIVAKIQNLIEDGSVKIAVLFRARNRNTEAIEMELNDKGIPYFYGMFADEDPEYVEFHNKCQEIFINRLGESKAINKKTLAAFVNNIKTVYTPIVGKTTNSLLDLLNALIKKMSIDYADLAPEDKYTFLLDIFENRQLKQAMEYVDSQVILSTIHGAKGLEWDYTILGDVERWIFPGYYTCSNCPNKFSEPTNNQCSLPSPLPNDMKEIVLDELSVFYVGITRARKRVFVSASAKRLDINGNEKDSTFSCMPGIPGVNLVPETEEI